MMHFTAASQPDMIPGAIDFPLSLLGSGQLPVRPEVEKANTSLGASGFDRDRATAECLSMVRFMARQLHARLPQHVALEDLISAGTLGLIDAAAKFDGNKEIQFKSYAQFRIRGEMLDSLRATDWSPRVLRRQGRLIEQAVRDLSSRGVQAPTDNEIAHELGMSLGTYQQLLADLKGLEVGSLQIERNEDSGEQEINYIPGSPTEDPLFRCLQGEMRGRLAAAIDTLPEKERLVLSLYYHEELTMREISQVLGVVESRVSQMHSSAVLRLRGVLGAGRKEKVNTRSSRKMVSAREVSSKRRGVATGLSK